MNDNEPTDVAFTVADLCGRWKCDRHTVLDAIRDGRLEAFRLGKRAFRVTPEAVRAYELAMRRKAV